MRALLAAFALGLATVAGAAEGPKAPPRDEGAQQPAFAAYRAELLDAVVRRDIDAILARTSPAVELSFGGDAGHAAFRARMTVDPETLSAEYRHLAPEMRESYWAELETVLRMGGVFEDDGRSFVAPYTWAVELPEGWDAFETYFVTGRRVALRDRPIRYGEIVARLDYDVVRRIEGGEGTDYARLRLADGTEGYVHLDFLRSAVGYRAGFELRDGAWRLAWFLAGD